MKSYTDISQSKKLVEILPLESADMYYPYNGIETYPDVKNGLETETFILCWSLAALLNVIPGGQVNRMLNSDKWEASSWNDSDFEPQMSVEGFDKPVDACYELILKLHELKML